MPYLLSFFTIFLIILLVGAQRSMSSAKRLPQHESLDILTPRSKKPVKISFMKILHNIGDKGFRIFTIHFNTCLGSYKQVFNKFKTFTSNSKEVYFIKDIPNRK